MYSSADLSARIKQTAKSKNILIKDLLSDCGLSVNAISQISDKKGISCFPLAKIADYLGCSVDYLLGRTEEPTGYASPDRLDSELDELYRYIRSLPEEEQQRLTTLLWNILETIKAEAAKEP